MLEFIKKIFKNGDVHESKKGINIQFLNLEEWINEKSKPLMEDTNQKIEEILMKVNDEIEKSMMNVEILENARLQNPNIPYKAMQYMHGNRKTYARGINSFLGQMKINNREYFYLLDFCNQFDKLLFDLNKGTLRSYTILQEFFANETNAIAQNLRNFDSFFKALKSALNSEKMLAVNNTKEQIQEFKAKIKQKINLEVDLRNSEAELKLANNEKSEALEDIEKFHKSKEHGDFLNLNEDKKNKASSFYNDENKILQSFFVLERALRKYSHVVFEHEEIALKYISHPIETLSNDKDLVILKILDNLKNLLNENKLQIDEKKKEKSLEEIGKLSEEFFRKFLEKYVCFKLEIEELDNKIKLLGVADKNKKFGNRIEKTNMAIEKYLGESSQLKSEIAKNEAAMTNLKDSIKNSVKGIFNEEVEITV